MRTAFGLTIWSLALALSLPLSAHAEEMTDYCSAPPYVTRTIPPNVMILMDNSEDMLDPAYTGDYSPNATLDNYIGYFEPTECYSYSSNTFVKGNPGSSGECNGTDKNGNPAPFRGNLLNWATMSRYDVLQKVIVGGNATSKQGNAHTLVSISGGDWPDKTYANCIFQVNNGDLTITESLAGACSLLNPVPSPVAFYGRDRTPTQVALSPLKTFREMFSRGVDVLYTSASRKAKVALDRAVLVWENVDLVATAWAAQLTINPGALSGYVGESFSITLEGGGDNNTTYGWSTNPNPPAPWLLEGPSYTSLGNRKNYLVTWRGTPTVGGEYPFSVTLTDSKNNTPVTKNFTISIVAEDLKINTNDLPDGQVGVNYWFELNGQGGTSARTWTASGLPAGLTLGTYSAGGETFYVISGAPTTEGTSDVTLILSDDASDPSSVSVTLSLTINPAVEGLTITTNALPGGQENESYSAIMEASGGIETYAWSITGDLPNNVNMDNTGVFSGTLSSGTAGSYPVTITVTDKDGTAISKDFTIEIVSPQGHVEIFSESTLPTAYKDVLYSYKVQATGGCYFNDDEATCPGDNYKWSISGQPSWMSIDPCTGVLSGTPNNNQDMTYPDFFVSVQGCGGHVATKSFSLTSMQKAPSGIRAKSYTVKVELTEEAFTDQNGNDIHDPGEPFDPADDLNGNGKWDGKQGVFQKFWNNINPKARWGMTKFNDKGNSTETLVDACIPVDKNEAAKFYTRVQNATATSTSPLADGLYGVLNYYGFNSTNFSSYDSDAYSGCNNSDPMDDIPCRKNFVLVITSGSDVEGDDFTSASCTSSDPLVKNACFGYNTDFRDDLVNKQNVYTYIVNTMGSENNDVLEAAAVAGGGKYYEASDYSDLEANLIQAFEDILAQAASGTAVSVLTTSSRGIGSMVQAYFLPIRQDGEREVRWTGYTQNIWIDPKDNLREDTVKDHQLSLDNDKVLRLFFDSETNETKAALFTTDDEGQVENCSTPTIVPFADVNYNWEAGTELALQDPGDRKLLTSKKVVRVINASGDTVTKTFNDNAFTKTNVVDNTPALKDALNAEADDQPYSAANIVRYVRGECLETGVTGDTTCGNTRDVNFRDRRITVNNQKKVWKLGDIISSTPKVLANMPQNTYHLDYGDTTYHNYISSTDYRNRLSLALVGANDGVLHAFRVGYLQDKENLPTGIKAFFQNASDDTLKTKLGQEVWGYIPYNAFPYLRYLAEPNYCHIYFNDLSVRLVDASFGDPDDSDHDDPTDPRVVESWKTILIGGMRFGGACSGGTPAPPLSDAGFSAYYAIDVTDPAHPEPLWEFSDVDMGYATSFPSVVRTGPHNLNGNWYVLLGSGSEDLPKSSTDIGRSKPGYVYILDLKTGSLVKKIQLDHDAIVGDILAIDKDKNYHSETVYLGTSYKESDVWKGKLVSIAIPNQDLTQTWTPSVKYLLTGDYPITASPDAAMDASGNVWVYGGTGKYFSDVDEEDTATHMMFGVKDILGGTYPVSASAAVDAGGLADQTNVVTTGTVTGTTTACMHNPATNQFDDLEMVTSIAQTSAPVLVPAVGWKVHLSAGEKVITRPLAVGGLVDFLTYMPSSDECSYGGDSYLYALDYVTGVAPNNIAIRSPETTTDASGNFATSGEVTVAKGVKLGPGAPPTGEAIIVPPPKEGQEQLKKKIQIATGVIIEAENNPVISVVSKMVHWLKK